MKRLPFFLALFHLVALFHAAPAQAQSGPPPLVFTPQSPSAAPHGTSALTPPRLVFSPLPAQSAAAQAQSAALAIQNAALTSQITTIAAQAQQAALTRQITALTASVSALTPTVFGQPYTNPHTDGTHLVFAHYVVALSVGGPGPDPAGFVREMQEDKAMGVDGWALDAADYTQANYVDNTAGIFAAADAVGFKLFLCPDFANADLEKPAGLAIIQATLAQYANRPSYYHYQGRPFLSTYAGDGGGAAAVAAVYNPFLASLKAAGLTPYFVPGWPSTAELAAVNADGGWTFPSLSSPLSDGSSVPGLETLAASVQAAKTSAGVPLTWMQPLVCRTWNQATGQYEEYEGGRGFAAQADSAFLTTHPQWEEILTKQDFGDDSGYSSLAAGTPWTGLQNYNVPGFWPTQAGFQKEISYYNQRYKTGVTPTIGTDTVIVYNAPQFTGGQGTLYFTAFLAHSGFVRLSNVGSPPQVFCPPGVTHGSFPVTQAGTPLLELLQNRQVTKQVYGQPIVAVPGLTNRNTFSFYSVPGIKFSLPVQVPAGFNLDTAGLFVRSSRTANAAGSIGVGSLTLADEAAAPPAVFAQDSLNNPAGVGRLLDGSTLAGQDALSQYNGNGYAALYADPLGLYPSPLAYSTLGNTNTCYFLAGKPFPSQHTLASVRVVSTSADLNMDGQGGVALVNSQAPNGHYQGQALVGYIEKYAGRWTLTVKAEDNFGGDSTSAGSAVLASMTVNSLAPGEWYTVSADYDKSAGQVVFTAVPSNQQN